MRILILGLNFTPELTGIGKYSGELAQWLSEKELQVRVITAPPYYPAWRIMSGYSGFLYRRETLGAVEVWRCPLWVPKRVTGVSRIFHLASFSLSSSLAMLFSAWWRPDIILCIVPTLTYAPWAIFLSSMLQIPAWLHVHDFELDASLELGMFKRRAGFLRLLQQIERSILKGFDRVSTISSSMLEQLKTKGVEARRTYLFRNWVDTKYIFPRENGNSYFDEFNIPKNHQVVLYSGNMGLKQGLEVVIEAARLVTNQAQLTFVLCGDGVARKVIEQQSALLPNVILAPIQPKERLNELLNFADIHILPQKPGFADLVMPSKLGGILASGKPIIAMAKPGTEMVEVINGAGLIVPPGDARKLKEAILRLSRDSTLRKKLGAIGRKIAEEQLDKEEILNQLLAEINSLVHPK